jgi:mRNA interferase RelE/StbE
MIWTLLYHPQVEEDLEKVGPSAARRIVRAIDTKLTRAPLQFGFPLSGSLSDFCKLRVGDRRIVYQVKETRIIVSVLTVGPRRGKESWHREAVSQLIFRHE